VQTNEAVRERKTLGEHEVCEGEEGSFGVAVRAMDEEAAGGCWRGRMVCACICKTVDPAAHLEEPVDGNFVLGLTVQHQTAGGGELHLPRDGLAALAAEEFFDCAEGLVVGKRGEVDNFDEDVEFAIFHCGGQAFDRVWIW